MHTKAVTEYLQELGLRINWKKSCLAPEQVTTILGLQLNSQSMRVHLSGARWLCIQRTAQALSQSHMVSASHCILMLGLMAAASAVVPLSLLHMRHLQSQSAHKPSERLSLQARDYTDVPSDSDSLDGLTLSDPWCPFGPIVSQGLL